ncbi:interferon-induced protein 44-like isoform X2 [Ruditapes philippinarum]|uniref:interferon-induced protein 44-like isoform X2 n=1 Tax=Ruditapes philippinarum TaxID=129788 RepID=UPI00295AC40E|nr:interferon-induced protein 44-like isoform X2 [Ruditapes philippinarum]
MMTVYNNNGHKVPVQAMPNGVIIPSNGQMNGHFIYAGDQRHISEVPTQWRPTNWSRENLLGIKGDIMSFTPSDPSVTRTRILMIGLVGAGKSSFYNTIDSVFRNRITQRATCGSAENSLTKNFSSKLPVSWWNFKIKPSANDRVHCIAFVIDATSVDVLSKEDLHKIRTFQELAKERGIVQTVVLTKIDTLCKDVKRDISSAVTSPVVETAVQKVADLLRLPRNNVFPMKNYENETELDDKISILALSALRQMLHFTEDALQKKKEEAEHAKWPCNIL